MNIEEDNNVNSESQNLSSDLTTKQSDNKNLLSLPKTPFKSIQNNVKISTIIPNIPPEKLANPSKITNGAPVRQYLNSNITPYLLQGLRIIAHEKPNNPLKVLGEFLIQKDLEINNNNNNSNQQ
ncbi:Sdc1p ASCRUDRAFT_33017 [Ascoidea rubescens DSM 1968]|uniref:Dpy-30-domain-containing protein n=1 Tax=Ascoidea rubescens DSM 1968 TaxID=1344418 RepID=A0A1D2VKD9_9ASCO|nr:hypothetical protein ASCRUDRAFT_33017 [Ascoidea rubescens DSM 1968]ODV62076.1 hypothetical protein ASCRUDRAFT_33017 [Ascoidea rubescens DSM 1968]